ncbi:MAG: HEAT repeat domain-containing protein [Kiritimatiellae bacterium]|nr:HEAT repeat domain-containing protein [Kiritimatiellia bacterium]
MMDKKTICTASLALAAAAACVVVLMHGDEAVEPAEPGSAASSSRRLAEAKPAPAKSVAEKVAPKAKPVAAKKRPSRWRRGRRLEGVTYVPPPETPMSEEERKISEELSDALDSDKRSKVYEIAMKALKSSNPDLRREAVEALGWYGKDAIADLLVPMVDPDRDVAERAIDNWDQALSEIESPQERMRTAMLALKVIDDEYALNTISAQFSNAANESIDSQDDPEKAMARRIEAVQMLVDIIESAGSNKVNVEHAKSMYSDITGNEWLSFEEAERYLQDPENYDPDEAGTQQEGEKVAGGNEEVQGG